MQPDPNQHEVPRDPVLDGRDSLRLVKLRLALTLIAVAILPIAAVSPLVRAVAEEARVAHHERLVDQARTAARRSSARSQPCASRRRRSSKIPPSAAAAQDASATERRLASERLAKFVDRPGSTLLAATLITGKGVRAEFGPAGDLRELPAGVLVAGLASLPGDPVRILVVGTSDGDAGPARTLVTAASVPALLAAATPKAELPGRVLRVADSGGLVLAESTGPFDPSALPGEVLDLATMAAHDSDGRTEINLPGIEGWHVVVAAPIPLIEMPVQALAALGAMLVLLVVFTMWMARQILRPAQASRTPGRASTSCTRVPARRPSATA